MSYLFHVKFGQLYCGKPKILNSISTGTFSTVFGTCNHEFQEYMGLLFSKRTFALKSRQANAEKPPKPISLRNMFHDYWYVAIPVHALTSLVWFGSCYYATEHGFDVIVILKKLGVKEDYLNFLRDSSMGHLSVAFVLYKVVGPFRFATTFVLSTIAMRYFSRTGLLKPIKNPFTRKKI